MSMTVFLGNGANQFSACLCLCWLGGFVHAAQQFWKSEFPWLYAGIFTISFLAIAFSLNIRRRFQYRHIPGPTPWPFVGNYFEMLASGGAIYYQYDLLQKFAGSSASSSASCSESSSSSSCPPTVIMYWLGSTPVLVVADLSLAHSIMNRRHDEFVNRSPVHKSVPRLSTAPLLFGIGQQWKNLKTALLNVFQKSQIRAAHRIPTSDKSIESCETEWRFIHPQWSGQPISLYDFLQRSTLRDSVMNIWGLDLFQQPALPIAAICQALQDISIEVKKVSQWFIVTADLGWLGLVSVWLSVLPRLLSYIRGAKIMMAFNREVDGIKTVTAFSWNAEHAAPVPWKVSIEEYAIQHKDAQLPKEFIRNQCYEFLFGSVDTIALVLTGAIYHLAKDPDKQIKLRKELWEAMKENGNTSNDEKKNLACAITEDPSSGDPLKSTFPYLTSVIYESLRMYPPGQLFRVNSSPILLAGSGSTPDVVIPTGVAFHIPYWSFHMSEDLWNDPFAFQPERFVDTADQQPRQWTCFGRDISETVAKSCRWLSFGSGPRRCLGEHYAVLSAKVKLAELIQHFEIELIPDVHRPATKDVHLDRSQRTASALKRLRAAGHFVMEEGIAHLPKEMLKIQMKKIDISAI